MKVFLVTNSLSIGGLSTVIIAQVAALKRLGHEPHVVTMHGIPPLHTGCPIHTVPLKDSSAPAWYRLLYALCRPVMRRMGNLFLSRRNQARLKAFLVTQGYSEKDVVILHGFRTVMKLGAAPLLAAISVMHETPSSFLSEGNSVIRAIQRRIVGNTLLRGKTLVAVSESVKQDFIDNFNAPASSVEVVYNGIDMNALRTKSQGAPEADIDGRYIISVGRLDKVKGFDVLIRAFAHLSAPGMKLVIVGEGRERAALERLIHELGMEDRVILAGHIRAPFSLVAGAEFFVSASWSEGFGLAALEAASLGVPVICTGADGMSEVIKVDKRCLFAPGDVPALCHAMETMLREGPFIPEPSRCFDIESSVQSYLALNERREQNNRSRA